MLVVDEAMALGGVERVWLALVPELVKKCEHLVWLLPAHTIESTYEALPFDSGVTSESFHWAHWNASKLKSAMIKRIARKFSRFNPIWARRLEQSLFNERLEHIIQQHRITHVLYPALFKQPFPRVSVPVFATVNDINYHPSWRNECIESLRVWAEQANHLLAISSFTKNEVEKVCPEACGKIVAIPLASDPVKSWQMGEDPGEPVCFYYPASFNPHKRHLLLLKALHHLHEKGLDFRLILTGGGTLSLKSKLPLVVPELEAARRVVSSAPSSFHQMIDVRGRVSTEEVDTCYAFASLVVLPSSYEGFGLPLAEAVARGKRVVCADIPAFREQVDLYGFKEAVTFVGGSSISMWASAIQDALRQPSQSPYSHEELRLIFERRSWENVADDFVRVMVSRE